MLNITIASSIIVILGLGVACDDPGGTPGAPGASGGEGGGGAPGGGGDVGGETPVSPDTCASRCQPKAQSCGAPSETANFVCADLCARALSAAELDCLEGAPCSELQALLQGGTVCDIGAVDDGGGSSGGGSSGGGGGSGDDGGGGGGGDGGDGGDSYGDADIGDECDCEGASGFSICEGAVTQCERGLSCVQMSLGGECVGDPCDPANDDCPSGLKCVQYGIGASVLASFCSESNF